MPERHFSLFSDSSTKSIDEATPQPVKMVRSLSNSDLVFLTKISPTGLHPRRQLPREEPAQGKHTHNQFLVHCI